MVWEGEKINHERALRARGGNRTSLTEIGAADTFARMVATTLWRTI
jgi:hypothetical protein